MTWLRRSSVLVLSLVLLASLLGTVGTLGLKDTLSSPDKFKADLEASGIYDSLATSKLKEAQKAGEANNSSGSVSLNNPVVQQAAKDAFPPELLRSSTNAFVDGNYNWLAGKTATPEFSIDLSQPKQKLADQVGKYVETRLSSLPACTPEQLAQLQIPADPLTVNCRPALLDPKTEGTRVAQEINDNEDFLRQPIINARSLGQDTAESGQAQGEPYYKSLSRAPQIYQFLLKAPLILGVLALLSILGLIFIAVEKRRGIRQVGIVFALAGVILVAVRLASDMIVRSLKDEATSSALGQQLKQPIADLVGRLESRLVQFDLWFGIIFLIVALVVFIWLFKTREGAAKPKAKGPAPGSTIAPEPEQEPAPQPSPKVNPANVNLAPRRRPPSTRVTDLRPKPAERPKPTGPPPIGKTPPRRKPPRLVQ